MVEGDLPIEISRESFKYQRREVTRDTEATIQQLEATVTSRAVRSDNSSAAWTELWDR
jgi:hypothetical protein